MLHFDPTDLRLLDLLQHDAALSNQELAHRAHTSPATALRPSSARTPGAGA